jgi:hypothetical protein
MNPDYLGIIKPEELRALRRAQRPGATHPVVNLAFAPSLEQTRRRVAANTELAARLVLQSNETWLRNLRSRLLDADDFTQASSALGEIRAFGALLETWMTITPAPPIEGTNASPEFQVDNGDGTVIVEVHSRQLDEQQVKALHQHHADLQKVHSQAVDKAKAEGSVESVVTTGESEVFPTGAPDPHKAGDSVLTNTISRIASIKQTEEQIDPSKPFVLWLDLQDPTVWGLPIADELFSPLYTENKEGIVGTGGFWFALYGRKGDPLIESQGYDYRSMSLAHEGRFYQTMTKGHGGATRISAVVYSLPTATILMENPNAALPLPPRVRAAMLKLPFFRLDLSIVEWEPRLVTRTIENQKQMINAAASALTKFDAAG